MAIADPRLQTEAPTQETGTLPGIPDAERRSAGSTLPRVEPGRYLALERNGDVELLPLDSEVVRIGRSPSTDVVLEHPSVSRRHALVDMRRERPVILDDLSLNGVFVNGERVAEAELKDGDVIHIGHVALRFVESA